MLKDLADLNLISISNSSDDGFLQLVNKLRAKASATAPALDEITEEVEIVRSSRYRNQKGSSV